VTTITQDKATETLLKLFEEAIAEQVKLGGVETAHAQATNAGLNVSSNGKVVRCDDDPTLVLLRLIKNFTEGGNILALSKCTPLINEMIARLGLPDSTNA